MAKNTRGECRGRFDGDSDDEVGELTLRSYFFVMMLQFLKS